jgi:hypothetical protein
VIRYFIRWRERYLHFTKESFNHNQSANKIVASDVLYASEQEREEQQELQVDDDDHFQTKVFIEYSSQSSKILFPFPFSHRMQHVRSEKYDTYCFPPLTTVQ